MNEAVFETVAEGLRFPEGPIALPNGDCLVVEISGQALTRISPDGTKKIIAELEGGPNGAAMGPDDWCYITNSGGWIYEMKDGLPHTVGQSARRGWIERVNINTGEVQRVYEGVGDAKLASPNDLVFDSKGGFWFTDHGKRTPGRLELGGIYYAKADGSHIEQVIANTITANGIGLSPDEQTVYIAETVTRRLLAFDLNAPGKPRFDPWPAPLGGRLVAGFPDTNNLDSLAVDSEGNICIGTLNNGGISIVSPDGEKRDHLALPDFFVTNICFGGSDLKTAYATLSSTGRLVKFDWPRAGTPLNFLNR